MSDGTEANLGGADCARCPGSNTAIEFRCTCPPLIARFLPGDSERKCRISPLSDARRGTADLVAERKSSHLPEGVPVLLGSLAPNADSRLMAPLLRFSTEVTQDGKGKRDSREHSDSALGPVSSARAWRDPNCKRNSPYERNDQLKWSQSNTDR